MACKGKLYFVGMGLASKHVTKQALDALADSDLVFVDTYTSFYEGGLMELVKKYAPSARVVNASRKILEDESYNTIIRPLLNGNRISIVSAGDPFTATTHSSIRVEALKNGCRVEYIPGISVYSYAVSLSGLFNYKFGASATIVYPYDDNSEPSSHAYNIISANKSSGFHTFLFLDIDSKRGPMKPDYALEILLSQEEKYRKQVITPSEKILVLERLGHDNEKVYYLTTKDVIRRKWDNPPYSIIVPGQLNPIEQEILEVLWVANGTK